MIRCKECGKENLHYDTVCKSCGSPSELSEEECLSLIHEADLAIRRNGYTEAVDIYKLLAAAGNPVGERELGLILEKGLLLPRDTNAAMQYFYSAARHGDPLAAYKYSRLVVGNQALAQYWLAFSAIMGCEAAYAEAFSLYDVYKERDVAAYYCYLLAESGDTDAIIEMARRHLYGEGVEQNEKYAKWYIERIERIPLHAVKLGKRLLSVTGRSIRPQPPVFAKKEQILKKLIDASKKFGYNKALLLLCREYRAIGGCNANVYLALMHIEGIEFVQNVEEGINMLTEAMNSGSVIAAKKLGDLYADGKFVDKDDHLAAYYYKRAAEMGGKGEYEALGDIFRSGVITEPDYPLALSLYQRGADEGDFGCKRKLKMMEEERERCYVEATRLERSNPDEAFRLFKRAADSGYLPAHARIGWYYEKGIGTKVDRKAAFYHYKTAYDAGDRRAIESLGRCYARGIGVAFNFKRASELLSIAREMGSRSADQELRRIYENKKRHMLRSLYSTAMELYYNQKYDVAISMLQVCADLGLGEATYAIGCLYEFGIMRDADRKAAMRYYKKAQEQGFSDQRQYHKQSMLRLWKQNK